MKSGLEDRNNQHRPGGQPDPQVFVSMKSGLEDRNNRRLSWRLLLENRRVSMKSGLEDRNNPGRVRRVGDQSYFVSMKSGLEDRNNPDSSAGPSSKTICLNEVRPGRPEQCAGTIISRSTADRLNEVRPGRPEQYEGPRQSSAPRNVVSMKSGLEDRNNIEHERTLHDQQHVSMKSGLEDRNNPSICCPCRTSAIGLNEVRPGRPEQ